MNREIKFRFYSKILNNFVTPDDSIFRGALNDPQMVVMQYTGLKDKNGKEIYEGDIMRGEPNYDPDIYGEYDYHTVCFGQMDDNRYGWYLENYSAAMAKSVFEEFEVIGNIWENPELLEDMS